MHGTRDEIKNSNGVFVRFLDRSSSSSSSSSMLVFLPPVNPFELTTQDPSQIGRLAPHRILVNCDKFLEGLYGQRFREILHHTEDSLVEGTVDLAGVLDVLKNDKAKLREKKSCIGWN